MGASDDSEPEEESEADDLSDFEVDEDEVFTPRSRGRPRKDGAGSEGSQGASGQRGRQYGQRRSRGSLSPGQAAQAAQNGPRARRRPTQLSEEQAAEQAKRKETKKRKAAMAAAAADEEFNIASVFHARTTSLSIAEGFVTRCCKKDAMPMAPRTEVGFHDVKLPFQCTGCKDLIVVATGAKVRINLDVDSEDEAEEEQAAQQAAQARRRRKPRKKSNGRPEDVLRAVIGALLSGRTYVDYQRDCAARNLQYIHHSTFDRYLGKLLPWIEKMADESVDLVRYLVARYGRSSNGVASIGDLVLTEDFFWQTRGHYARNGTGTICDYDSGGVLSYRHFCQSTDKLSNRGGFEWTSKAMDPIACDQMLKEIVSWMDNDLDKLTEEWPDELSCMPKLDSVVLDGDASTNANTKALVGVVEAAAAAAGQSTYCKELRVRPCGNHLAKNCGAYAGKMGHSVHTLCKSCAIVLRADGEERADQRRDHRGCNGESHALVKCYQRGLSAALRGAKLYKGKPGYEGQSMKAITIAGVEEMYNHFRNVHDGPGFHTGSQRVCRNHPAQRNGEPYESSQWNDCGDFNDNMKAWLKTNVIEPAVSGDLVSETRGVVCQNASERVGMVALGYRDKDVSLGPTHYVCSTGLTIGHCNGTVIECFRLQLLEDDATDGRIKAWGCMEEQLHRLIGLSFSTAQSQFWRRQVYLRAKRSRYRKSREYKVKRKKERGELTKTRGKLKSSREYQYKGCTGGRAGGGAAAAAAGNGAVGACTCKGQCCRGCPCKAAGKICTPQCHGGRCCRNAAGGALVVQPVRSGGAGSSSSGGAGSSGSGGAGRGGASSRPEREQPSRSARGAARPDVDWPDAQLDPPPLDNSLIGRKLAFHFPEHSWCVGEVIEPNDDDDEMDGDDVANFIVEYDDDDQAHYLTHYEYSPAIDAPPGSWYVVRHEEDD